MEKFSKWRDPATGIQPFLTPVPPAHGISPLWIISRPLVYSLGVVRALLLVAALAIYLVGTLLETILSPIILVRRIAEICVTRIGVRVALWALVPNGVAVDVVSRRKGRLNPDALGQWAPQPGDIIVSNWVSWVELLWLAARYGPVFVVPVFVRKSSRTAESGAQPTIIGYRKQTLLQMCRSTGFTPRIASETTYDARSLIAIRGAADRPVVVFPEGTTSNGRAILRFADTLADISLPSAKFSVFVMCLRYEPPAPSTPSLSHSIPSGVPFVFPNPLPHLMAVLFSMTSSRLVSIKLLAIADSPSSPLFPFSEYLLNASIAPPGEVLAQLIAQIGKLKRVGLGWEDKDTLLSLQSARTSRSGRS